MVQVLVAVIVIALAIVALVGIEIAQRRRGGRGLPVLRTLPTRRVRTN